MTIVGVLVGLLIIGLMMLVHEAGHFFAGKALKFKIIEFSIFMGPRIFTTEKNGIKYSFKLLPIGASVQFAGEYQDDETIGSESIDPNDPGLFFNRPRWARAIVVAMGPAANFLTAFLASIIMFSAFGVAIPVAAEPPENSLAAEQGLSAGDKIIRINGQRVRTGADYSVARSFINPQETIFLEIIKPDGKQETLELKPRTQANYRLGIVQGITGKNENVVLHVEPDSNHGNPVLEVGDKILSVNGIPFSDRAATDLVFQSKGETLHLTLLRDGKEIAVDTKTTLYHDPVNDGIYFTESRAFGDIVYQAIQYPWSIIKSTIRGITMIIDGSMKFSEGFTGPVGIVKIFDDVVQESPNIRLMIEQLLFYFILISVAIGFTNLLPIPPLDGHHLLILAIEGIRGKDLPQRFKHIVTAIGMILILILAGFIIYFDLRKIF
ncbi:MAG TPA: RIP metalloprotease RseP [Clostridiaceae bacterium]|nr:RIP metalloprotease RseP [Clostridiaceae bacterium]